MSNSCPACGGELKRISRSNKDRLFSHVIPLRRVKCRNPKCQWEGVKPQKSVKETAKKLKTPLIVVTLLAMVTSFSMLAIFKDLNPSNSKDLPVQDTTK